MNSMKKIYLSLAVILAFGIYAVILRRAKQPEVGTVIAPAGLNTTTTSPTSVATSDSSTASASTPSSTSSTGKYKNGTYTGNSADAFYGNVQVQVTISGGKITDVKFLDYPQDRSTSREINSQAMPYLIQETLQAQSANVNTISGASATSGALQQSLASALSQAS